MNVAIPGSSADSTSQNEISADHIDASLAQIFKTLQAARSRLSTIDDTAADTIVEIDAALAFLMPWSTITADISDEVGEQSPPSVSASDLEDMSRNAPKGPWELRPNEYDDWGVIRAQLMPGDLYREIVLVARGRDDEAEKSRAREEHRQPRQCEAISAFTVAVINAYRSGDLIHRSTIVDTIRLEASKLKNARPQ